MATHYRPPEKINFQDPQWDAWRSSFQSFRAETKLDQELEEIQIATLKYSIGPESEKILRSLNMETTKGLSYNEVLSKFDWYFKSKKKNIITLRRHFYSRNQSVTENIEQFYLGLKTVAIECDFVDVDERVRDQMIFGVRNEDLSHKLEQLFVIDPAGFTLEKVIHVAKTFERSYGNEFTSSKTNARMRKMRGSIKIVNN